MSHLDRLTQGTNQNEEGKISWKQGEYFKFQKNGLPSSLVIHGLEGTDAIDYMHLVHKKYIPDIGILLFFDNVEINIYGRNLYHLDFHLSSKKVSHIRASDQELRIANNDEPVITNIDIAYTNPAIQKAIEKLENRDQL